MKRDEKRKIENGIEIGVHAGSAILGDSLLELL